MAEMKADKLRELLKEAVDIIEWMSGSSDFAPTGQAHEGWKRLQRTLTKIRVAAGLTRFN